MAGPAAVMAAAAVALMNWRTVKVVAHRLIPHRAMRVELRSEGSVTI